MIPVSQDERLAWKDEQDGITFYFRSMTGANEQKYVEIAERIDRDNKNSELKILDEMVDFFLVGWAGLNAPEFPADGKPSRFFKSNDKDKLIGIAMKLNKVGLSETKN